MQFTLLTLVTLFAAVMAAPEQSAEKRQNTQGSSSGGPTVQDAAMTNQNGDVVAFDSANVYLDSVNKGL